MVSETVRRARRRIIANQTLRYATHATSVALGSLIALLLAGTQILSWVWLLLLPALTLAIGIYLTWRRAPSLYRTAQSVDRSLRLADTLSTALFFASDSRGAPDMRRAQWVQAERAAASADVRRAVPLRVPRAIYSTALLALIAGSLFALRYGLDRRLDLRPPLARVVAEKFGLSALPQAARGHNRSPQSPIPPGETGISVADSTPRSPGELDAAPDAALESAGVPDVDNKTGSSRPDISKLAQSASLDGGDNQDGQPEGVSTNSSNPKSGDGKQGPGAGRPGQGDSQQASANSSESSGLLGKFRDAVSSLLNRMRQTGGNNGQQQAGVQNGRQNQQSGAGQNGKQNQQPTGAQQADSRDGQPGDDSQSAQASQPGSAGESGQQPATKQPGSGIGRQDGNKDVKLAEQLAAMGKISEIIGKRAANLSGEVTVEVENSNQQLRTPYAQSTAHHAEAGGEIHRDEIPVALQAYVQQYFEQVRKQAAATAARTRHQAEPPKPGL